MAKYIRCECCGKRIDFGSDVYRFGGHRRLCCSADCFADSYGEIDYLNDELADDCWCHVFDDEERQREIKAQMETHKQELERLQRELDALNNTKLM